MQKNKGGRPRAEIPREEFEKLCMLQCTLGEIAGFFGCSVDTVERWCYSEYKKGFAEVYKQKRKRGLISLRRKQWKLADTSPAMAIFLGKNMLGQSDRPTPPGFDPRAWGTSQGEGAVMNGYTGTETEGTDD